MTSNYHQSLAMILLEKWLEINPMRLSSTLKYYKNQDLFITSRYPQELGRD